LKSNAASDVSARWRAALLRSDATVQQVVRSLNDSGLQIVLIVSADDVLLGTVTDGDIRRGLLRGLELGSPVEAVMNRSPFVAPLQLGRELVLELMRANKIRQLPIVDSRGVVAGLHLLDQLLKPTERTNLMVVMAGGEGTRLRPHTQNCPKPLLAVAGKPMLEHIIVRAKSEGFSRFVLAVHYLGHMIEEYFGDGERWGVKIHYIREREPLGTAGAVRLLSPRPDAPFLVTNGDVLTNIRYGELLDFHIRHGASATMAVRLHEWQHPFGVVRTKGVDIVGFEEKPIARSHVNAGIYVLEPLTAELLSEGERCDMPALFERVQRQSLRTIVYPMHEPWLDVGRPDDYESAQQIRPGETT
jgi:dTDP-glucose pyrophosphorylase